MFAFALQAQIANRSICIEIGSTNFRAAYRSMLDCVTRRFSPESIRGWEALYAISRSNLSLESADIRALAKSACEDGSWFRAETGLQCMQFKVQAQPKNENKEHENSRYRKFNQPLVLAAP
jgi:hypothetical protein